MLELFYPRFSNPDLSYSRPPGFAGLIIRFSHGASIEVGLDCQTDGLGVVVDLKAPWRSNPRTCSIEDEHQPYVGETKQVLQHY